MPLIKKSLAVVNKYEAFYTGGNIQISSDGQYIFCGYGHQVKVMDLDTGKIKQSVGQEEEEISAFCLSPNDEFLVLATHSLLLRKWTWQDNVLLSTWKTMHRFPVTCMAFDPTSTLLATGGSDCVIKVWDSLRQYCTHNLRGHTAVVRLVEFHPDTERLQLISCAEDYTVRVWDLLTSACLAAVTDDYTLTRHICFTGSGDTMYSCGGDSVVSVWDMTSLSVVKRLSVIDNTEAVLVPDNLPSVADFDAEDCFLSVGSQGSFRVIKANTGACQHVDSSLCAELGTGAKEDPGAEQGPARKKSKKSRALEREGGKALVDRAFHCRALDKLVVVTSDRNILLLNTDFSLHKQFCGHLEEVLDIGLLGAYLVVISNSRQVKVFQRASMECQLLSGHSDSVLSVSTQPKKNLFVTASKDQDIRVWRMDPDTGHVTCVAVGKGHAEDVNTVTFSRLSGKFVVSAGKEHTVKLWNVPSALKKVGGDGELVSLHAAVTVQAHENEVNSVSLSHNDRYLASASRDKTVKVWSIPDLNLEGVARGHKRGVWSVQFSPVDMCFATSSADGTIKVWNLVDFSCLQTLEGHDSSVLQVAYISEGKQLISSDSEGLLKLWTLKTSMCERTVGEHEGAVWALTVAPDEQLFFTGAADSTLITWKDTTEEEEAEARDKESKLELQSQTLSNYLQEKKLLKAIRLAITLDQPFTVLKILKDVLMSDSGYQDVKDIVSKLKPEQLGSLLNYCSEWNTTSRNCYYAQVVVNIALKNFPSQDLLALPDFNITLERLLPYTERHFDRADGMVQQTTFTQYTATCLKS